MNYYTIILKHDVEERAVVVKAESKLDAVKEINGRRIGKVVKVYEMYTKETLPQSAFDKKAMVEQLIDEAETLMTAAHKKAEIESTPGAFQEYINAKKRYLNLLENK